MARAADTDEVEEKTSLQDAETHVGDGRSDGQSDTEGKN